MKGNELSKGAIALIINAINLGDEVKANSEPLILQVLAIQEDKSTNPLSNLLM